MKIDHRFGFEQEPVLCVFPTTGECPRCKGASKVPNLEAGPHLVDCPTCEGTGRIEMLEPIVEADLDEAVLLGMELAQLRAAKATALDAARVLRAGYAEIIEALSQVQDAALDRARAAAAEGEAQASDLITVLEGGAK